MLIKIINRYDIYLKFDIGKRSYLLNILIEKFFWIVDKITFLR